VYPSDAFEKVDLGVAVTACRVRLFSVDVRDLRRDLQRLTDEVLGPSDAPTVPLASSAI